MTMLFQIEMKAFVWYYRRFVCSTNTWLPHICRCAMQFERCVSVQTKRRHNRPSLVCFRRHNRCRPSDRFVFRIITICRMVESVFAINIWFDFTAVDWKFTPSTFALLIERMSNVHSLHIASIQVLTLIYFRSYICDCTRNHQTNWFVLSLTRQRGRTCKNYTYHLVFFQTRPTTLSMLCS